MRVPIERRRADAAVEVIDAIARPDLLDELTPTQLRRLADHLENQPDSPAQPDSRTQPARHTQSNSRAGSSAEGADDETAAADTNAEIDEGLTDLIDAGQVSTDTCIDAGPETANSMPASGIVPTQRPRTTAAAPPDSGPGARAGRRAARPARGRGGKRVRGERPSLVVLVPYDTRDTADIRSTGDTGDTRGSTGDARDGRDTRSTGDTDGSTANARDGRDSRSGRDRLDNSKTAPGGLRTGEISSTGSARRLASATEIERVACEATITPVWLASGVEPVAVATPTRFFRGKQLAALIARDRGCCFPGCSRGLRYAHAHHIIPISRGGETKVDNGVLLCSHHHRLVHRAGGWLVRIDADGLPLFIPPAWIDPDRQPQRHARHQIRTTLAA